VNPKFAIARAAAPIFSGLRVDTSTTRRWSFQPVKDALMVTQGTGAASLLVQAEGFPQRLQRDAEAAAEQARRDAQARFEQQILVAQKDAETERRLAALRVKALDDTVAHQAAQLAALEKQLAEAKQQVQDIAVKAIEGASAARALSHINQIAMEQAKNRPQG
jgi:uncharacterized coiled-coil protein SlyX